jgi:hypothetical protein
MLHRRGIAWCEALEHLPPEKMLEEMARAGVDGLILDTRCREDTGWLREPPLPFAWRRTEDLHCYLLAQGLKPIESQKDQVFFDLREILRPYRERLGQDATTSGSTQIQPTTMRYVTHWAYVRPTHLEGWTRNRQCLEGQGSLELVNHTPQPIEVSLRFALQEAPGTASQCEVKSPLLKADPWVVEVGKHEVRFTLPPGRHPVHFQSLVNGRKAPVRLVLDQIALDVIDPAATVVGR